MEDSTAGVYGACNGLALAGPNAAWALYHNNSAAHRERNENGAVSRVEGWGCDSIRARGPPDDVERWGGIA